MASSNSATPCPLLPDKLRLGASFSLGVRREPTIDLEPHDLAVRERVVVAALQRTRKVLTGLGQGGDFRFESLESIGGNGLPFADVPRVEDSCDVLQREPGVLEHADEHESPECGHAVTALSGLAGIGDQEVEPF